MLKYEGNRCQMLRLVDIQERDGVLSARHTCTCVRVSVFNLCEERADAVLDKCSVEDMDSGLLVACAATPGPSLLTTL